MLSIFRNLWKILPTLLLSFALALAVWISAVTASDPMVKQDYPHPVSINIVGQDPGLVITNSMPTTITIKINAPQTQWDLLTSESNPIRAFIDLSGLQTGLHTVHIQVQGINPAEVVSYSPSSLDVSLEKLETLVFQVQMVQQGQLAIGYQAGTPVINPTSASISGPESAVKRVKEVEAVLDLSQVHENINRTLPLQAVDINDGPVTGLTISPSQITVSQSITQMGGYRNVVVKVMVTGQIADGYRLTNLSVFPPAVTVFSTDPNLVNTLPGYVETAPLALNNAKDDLDVKLGLSLPPGVSVVGDQAVEVIVGVAAIESSLTLSNQPVVAVGLPPGLAARTSPESVDVILSGPLPLLDALSQSDVRVTVDMTGAAIGTYQRTPKVELTIPELNVESILPGTVEVVISNAPTPTVTPRP
ncbi:MAG: CdaR family protein [Anaerolineaceae bacterium]|nr:CdaR family protein [Anaerolineaceae bacterium]